MTTNQLVIRKVLTKLNIQFKEIENIPTSHRFRLLNHNLPNNTFLNIPKNKNFVLQVLFEGKKSVE